MGMGRPKMSAEEKEKAAKKREWLRARGKLAPLGTMKRGKRIGKKVAAKVEEKPKKKMGRPFGSKNTTKPMPVEARERLSENLAARPQGLMTMEQSVMAVSVGLHNLTVRVDQTIASLQASLIESNKYVAALYQRVNAMGHNAAPSPQMPLPTQVVDVTPKEPAQETSQANGTEAPKRKGRPPMSDEEKARRAVEKVNATPVQAEPVVLEPVAIAVPEEHQVKPVVPATPAQQEDLFDSKVPPKSEPVAAPQTTKVIQVPDSQAYNPTSGDLGLD